MCGDVVDPRDVKYREGDAHGDEYVHHEKEDVIISILGLQRVENFYAI